MHAKDTQILGHLVHTSILVTKADAMDAHSKSCKRRSEHRTRLYSKALKSCTLTDQKFLQISQLSNPIQKVPFPSPDLSFSLLPLLFLLSQTLASGTLRHRRLIRWRRYVVFHLCVGPGSYSPVSIQTTASNSRNQGRPTRSTPLFFRFQLSFHFLLYSKAILLTNEVSIRPCKDRPGAFGEPFTFPDFYESHVLGKRSGGGWCAVCFVVEMERRRGGEVER